MDFDIGNDSEYIQNHSISPSSPQHPNSPLFRFNRGLTDTYSPGAPPTRHGDAANFSVHLQQLSVPEFELTPKEVPRPSNEGPS